MDATLAIVSGAANGKLGGSLLRELSQKDGVTGIGIARQETGLPHQILQADLLDREQLERSLSQIDLNRYKRILVAHAVGRFKLEPWREGFSTQEQDPIILASNLETAKNLFQAVLRQRRNQQIPVTFLSIGSLAEKWQVPAYQSYLNARQAVHCYLQQLVQEETGVGGLYLYLGTVDVPGETALRPFADRTHWLKPEKFARLAVPFLLAVQPGLLVKQDLFEPLPGFDPYDQYVDLVKLRKRWRHDMGEARFDTLMHCRD